MSYMRLGPVGDYRLFTHMDENQQLPKNAEKGVKFEQLGFIGRIINAWNKWRGNSVTIEIRDESEEGAPTTQYAVSRQNLEAFLRRHHEAVGLTRTEAQGKAPLKYARLRSLSHTI